MMQTAPNAVVVVISGAVRCGRVSGTNCVRHCRTEESIVASYAHTTIPAVREMRGNGRKAVI